MIAVRLAKIALVAAGGLFCLLVGYNNIVNYGSDRLRFPSPVPSGCRIHTRYRVKSVQAVKSGTQVTMEINVHVVGQDRPSVINDLVMLYM